MKAFILASIVGLIGLSAEAGRNQNREARQEKRIGQGVKSGELTRHEAKKLNRGQKKIDKAQDKAEADGEVTLKEKARLENMQDRQSRKIYRQKNDAQSRPNSGDVAQPTETVAAPTE